MPMPVIVSMLRGVNLGPSRRIKMEHLREVYEGLGLRDVRTIKPLEEVLSGEAWVMPSKAPVVYEERRPASSVAALVLGPWAMAAQAARLWAALVTSAARR